MRRTWVILLLSVALVLSVLYPPRSILGRMHGKVLAALEQRWVQEAAPPSPERPDAEQPWLVPANSSKLLQYLTLRRKRFPYVGAGTIDTGLRARTLALMEQWPEELQAYMRHHVSEVLIVSNFGASGYVLSLDSQRFVILIDESVIGMTPNHWFRMKEGTIVNTEATGHTLLHRIEHDSADVPERLLEGILIHELAHCIGFSEGHTTDAKGRLEGLPRELSIFDGVFSWPDAHLALRPEFRERFPQLRYYGRQPSMPVAAYSALLSALDTSEFPTLYATVSDLEFFAEHLYTFIHCVEQGRPLDYVVAHGNDTVAYVSSPITHRRNAHRVFLMEKVMRDLRGKFDLEN
jgi:hypothetical protein